jgi:competence protein ComEC
MPPTGISALKAMPALRLLIPFISGILAGMNLGFGPLAGIALLMPALLAIPAFRILPIAIGWKLDIIRGISIQLLLMSFGILLLYAGNEWNRTEMTTEENETAESSWLLITEEPSEKRSYGYRTVAMAWKIPQEGSPQRIGKSLVYFSGADDMGYPPDMGSRIITNIAPQALQKNRNPGAFDPSEYYGRNGIRMRISLKNGDFILLPIREEMRSRRFLFGMRDLILKLIREHIRDPEAAGLAEALLIGYRNDLDRSLTEAYANTGVIHVIAISGLHLGLIYALLMSITGFMKRFPKGEWLQLSIVIIVLWIFSLVTGASPSVIRSACMFTLLAAGKCFIGKKGNPLNTLAATAFLLLAYQPNWLADIGFQLSFAAVASIMLFHEPVKKLLLVHHPLALKSRELIAMTLSAQVLTTPLVLFHFKRFPLLFLFTNMVAIPLSGFILMGEIALCALSWYPQAATWLGDILVKAIHWMNGYVRRMDSIEFSVIRDVYLSPIQVFICYVAVFSAAAWRQTGRHHWRDILLSAVLAFTILRTGDIIIRRDQKYLLIPHLNGYRSLMLVNGLSSVLITDRMGPEKTGMLEKMIAPTQEYFHVGKRSMEFFPPAGMIYVKWEKTLLLLQDATGSGDQAITNIHPDLIILSGNTRVEIEDLYIRTGCKTWVADGTNAMWKIQEWKKEAERLNLHFHSTSLSGAYILRIR